MNEEKQEALLDPEIARIIADTGPIEDHIEALATEWDLPDLSVAICTLRAGEAGPFLRDVLIRAADGEKLSEDDATLLFRGLYILGGAQDSLAFQPLLRLLRRPEREIDRLLGDAITESLARIVAGLFDGDADALFGLIADRAVDEYVRNALLGAATFLTWEGRIERDRMRSFLEASYEDRPWPDGDHAWIGWLTAIALLGLRDLAPMVYRAWDEDRLPDRVLDRHHFEKDLDEAERAPEDKGRFERAYLGYIDDVIEALDWTRGRGAEDLDSESPGIEAGFYSNEPVTNPLRHVGRNDPCPCGSGRKAKKCCLDAA